MKKVTLADITALSKRRGFVYPGSSIYGGLANTWDYGPVGIEFLRNIKNLWWEYFVTRRENIFGLDSAMLMSPKVWEASGHTQSFTDMLVECKSCHIRTRADHLIEECERSKGKEVQAEGLSAEELNQLIQDSEVKCPECGAFDWTSPRQFNLLFETKIGIVPENQAQAFLRGEIAQGMFVNFKNVLDSTRAILPFGLAQSGKAFRNEITKGNFIFRTLQFNLAELEYFFDPEKDNWEKVFKYWQDEIFRWTTKELGVSEKNLRWRAHTDKERSHYSKRTEDLDYKYPFGFKETYAVAYRTDFDLKNHMEKSGEDLYYKDPKTGKKIISHVVEPTFGMDRTFLMLLLEGYTQEKDRLVLKLSPKLAPYKVAVFPLLSNKPQLVKKARNIYNSLKGKLAVIWDDRGNIGKRYYAQDEIGTPWCVTVDFDSLKDDTVTVRDRDSAEQKRVGIGKLAGYFKERL